MGRHRAGARSATGASVRRPRHIAARIVLSLVAVVVLVAGAVAVLRPDSLRTASAAPCPAATTLRVTTASSFAPVLKAMEPDLAHGKDCLRLDVRVVDGRAAMDRIQEADTDVWIPDDGAWVMHTDPKMLTPRGQSGSQTVLATSPIYQVTDQATAARLSKAGGTWAALSMLLADSSVRLVVREPAGSGDGLVAFGALGETAWISKGMDNATEASVAARRVSRSPSGADPAIPANAGEVGLVPEYALIPLLDSDAKQLTITTGSDRTAMLRYTWLPLAAAMADPYRAAALGRLRAALTSKSADKAIAAAGLRRPGRGAPAGVPTGRLPHLAGASFAELQAHQVDHMFAAWYPPDRRANLLLVVDVSGSMAAKAAGTKTPLIKLVGSGCASVGALLPDDARIGMWEFGSLLDPPRDYRVLLPSAPLTTDHRRALSAVVEKLAAQHTGTGLYDTILAAYRSAVASYQAGMPNQVLVFTDAINESDPGGIAVGQLATQLKAAADPHKPVSLTVAEFGSKPTNGELKMALAPVMGTLVRVSSGQQVGALFVHVAVGDLSDMGGMN